MALLSSADYPTIRAALDVRFTAAELPDAIIAAPIYVGAAEAEVLRRDPLCASRTGAALAHVRNATMLLTAAYLAPAMPSLTGETIGDYQYAQKVDWMARAAELLKRADQELAAVLTPAAPTTRSRPTMFTVAPGTRGW